MRTHGGKHHTLGSVEGGQGRDSGGAGEVREGIIWGEMPDVGDREMEAANHIAMCVPMQQSCMICTCNPEPEVQFQKIKQSKILKKKKLAGRGGRCF